MECHKTRCFTDVQQKIPVEKKPWDISPSINLLSRPINLLSPSISGTRAFPAVFCRSGTMMMWQS